MYYRNRRCVFIQERHGGCRAGDRLLPIDAPCDGHAEMVQDYSLRILSMVSSEQSIGRSSKSGGDL